MDLIENAVILIIISLVWVIIVYLGLKLKIGNQNTKDKRTLLGGLLLFVAILAIFFAVTAIYEYAESTEFCGNFCHVMVPFYESYVNPGNNPMMSTHAAYDVSCSNCHNAGIPAWSCCGNLLGGICQPRSLVQSCNPNQYQ